MTVSPKVAAYVVDPLERAARTFGQQFIVFLTASGSATGLLANQHWLTAVEVSGIAAALSILTSVLTFWVPAQSPYVDLDLRVIKTFMQSVAATMLLSMTTNVDASLKGAIAVAIPVAGTALLLGLAAIGVPGTAGASLLPVTVNSAPLGQDAGSVVAIDADESVVVSTPSDVVSVPTGDALDQVGLSADEVTQAVLDARAEHGPRMALDSLHVSDGPTVVADNPSRPVPTESPDFSA